MTRKLALPEFLALGDEDFQRLDRYRSELVGDTDALASAFSAFLLQHPATAATLRDFSPERLRRLASKQADHTRLLLASHLNREWMDSMEELGRLHYRIGIEPAWLAGAYRLYWLHWNERLRERVPESERDAVREALFALIVGDLMAQLEGYASATRDTDAERLAVFEVLLQVLATEDAARDPNGQRLLEGICLGLVERSRMVAWTSYATQDQEDLLIARCMAGLSRRTVGIPRTAGDPCWEALDQGRPVIRSVDQRTAPEWIREMRGQVAEVACFPFGSGGLTAVGLVGAREAGYFQRVGSAYFLAFAHLGDLVLRMRAQALEDPLTGLPNRRLFAERLSQARRQNLRNKRLLAVAMLDLDGFKQVNDRLGHTAGDLLLQEVVQRLRVILRDVDTLARMGGDEFGLLLPDIERADDLEGILERIMGAIRTPFDLHGEPVALSGSLGVTLFPLDEGDGEALLHHADLALYAAKEQGRDQWQLHSWSLDAQVGAQAAARERVDHALRDGHLRLYYQPIVAPDTQLSDHGVLGVEALLRLQDPALGLLAPADFADALDHVRLARPIGRFVLETALAQAERWYAQGLSLRIAVNVSANHLLDTRFSADLAEALDRHPGVRPEFVEIEITESAPLRDFEGARRALEACQDLGVRVALDDFGTGSASLAYLQKLPAQTIKIDQSFVRDMINDPKDLAIVSGVITTARMLGLEVIAEGVETARHARLLGGLQCHLVQGYAIARPMPGEEIADWITRYHPDSLEGIVSAAPVGENEEDVFTTHAHRVHQFIAALQGLERYPEHVLEAGAESQCHLGTWLRNQGLSRFGQEPIYAILCARHDRLHELSRMAKAALDAGRQDEAQAVTRQLELENDAMLAELRALNQAAHPTRVG
ncbi:MAG: EAL domain-containing protein [Betaproteobacteria bacterium]|nr:EAL domain-containing protein [Betaproteobacteria bacterium]